MEAYKEKKIKEEKPKFTPGFDVNALLQRFAPPKPVLKVQKEIEESSDEEVWEEESSDDDDCGFSLFDDSF